MTTKEAARLLGVTVHDIRYLIKENKIEAEKVRREGVGRVYVWEVLDGDVHRMLRERSKLSEAKRKLLTIVKRRAEGLSHREIGELMGLTPEQVKSALYRAREMKRKGKL
jgi:excisionase family DNA binding protein